MKKTQIFLMLTFAVMLLHAQEKEFMKNTFQGTRFVNAHSTNLADKGELLLLIQHRFGDIRGGAYEFFGLDFASMRIGFEYGFGKNFNLGVGRSTYLKTFDGFAKYRILRQSTDFPLSLVVSAGGSVPTIRDYFPDQQNNFSSKASGNAQLHISKSFKRFGLLASPGFLRTGFLPDANDNLNAFTIAAGGSVKLAKKVSANLEYLHPFHKKIRTPDAFSLGVDIDTGRHLFQLILSNSQRMFTQAVYTSVSGDWTEGKLFLGFNLIREFNLRYYE